MSRPNNGARLRPNKAGVYYINWTADGRSQRVSTRTGNLHEAQKILAGFLLEQGKTKDGRMTIGAMFDYYDTNHVETKVRAQKKYRRHIRHFKAILGEYRFVDELAGDDFIKYATARRKQNPKLNDATLRNEMTCFIAAANYCVRNRKLENRHVPVIVLPDGNEPKDRWLTREEAQKVLKAAATVWDKRDKGLRRERMSRVYRLICIALATGKRRGSIEPLKWFQVDLKNRTIDFRRPGEPESNKRRGRAPISKWLLPILEKAYQEKINEFVLDTDTDLHHALRKVAKAAGFDDVSCHTLRHTWGTWAAQGGASLWQIAGVLGCSIKTAEANYLHHCPAHLRGVADQVSVDIDISGADNSARNDAQN